MKQEMIWATEAGISLHVEMLERSARFRIERGPQTLAVAEIEDWKFCRVIQILGGTAPQIRKDGTTPLCANAEHHPRAAASRGGCSCSASGSEAQ